MQRLPIRVRLTAAFAAAMVLVLVLAGLFVYVRVSSDLEETIETGLRSRADDLSALVETSRELPPELGGSRLVESDETFTQVLSADGELVASTLPTGTAPVLSASELERAGRETVLIDSREVAGIEATAKILARTAEAADGDELVVIAGATNEDIAEAQAGLQSAFLIGGPVGVVLASLLGYFLAGRSLAPVEAMRRRAAEITLERRGERLPLPPAEDELRRLGRTLNTMLDRIEATLERERVFVADASHELRTPLANLRTELELADRPGRSDQEIRAALRSAADEVDRLSQLAEDLLVIARSDQGRLPIKREDAELGALLERIRARFERRASELGREISVSAPGGARALLDPLRIEQALGNLVDNALRHGEGKVRIGASLDSELVTLDVSDEGGGFPDGFAAQAFERFTRADKGRTGGGAGLGLAIVNAIAEAHGGEAAVTSDGPPGMTVRISVPDSLRRHG